MKKIALLGAGEIGSAIKKIAEETGYKVLVRELSYDQFDGSMVEALHICIPYKNKDFLDFVANASKSIKAEIVIIHSTVPPGITKLVSKKIKKPTAHSSIRGNHPNLYKDIKDYFIKYVGGIDNNSRDLAIKHLKKLGIKRVKDAKGSLNSELGKIVNILGYAWSIIFCKWIDRICKEQGADFEIVYRDFTHSYNKGYKFTLPNVQQPILKPIKGPIGGHCVIPDTILLDKSYDNKFTKFILKENKLYKKEKT